MPCLTLIIKGKFEGKKETFNSSLVKFYLAQNLKANTNENKLFMVHLKLLACNQQVLKF